MTVSLRALLLVLLVRDIASDCDHNCWWKQPYKATSVGSGPNGACCQMVRGTELEAGCESLFQKYTYSHWWATCYCFKCTKNAQDVAPKATVRIVDANGRKVSTTTRGFAQVRRNYAWGYVCDDIAGNHPQAARVICRQLGQADQKAFGTATIAGSQYSRYAGFQADDLHCSNTHKTWEECKSSAKHNCSPSEGFQVQCGTPASRCDHHKAIPGSWGWWSCSYPNVYACKGSCCCRENFQYHSNVDKCLSCTSGLEAEDNLLQAIDVADQATIVQGDRARGKNILIGVLVGIILVATGFIVRQRFVGEKVEDMKDLEDEEVAEGQPLVAYQSAVTVGN